MSAGEREGTRGADSSPTVTVVIPCYNLGAYVSEAVQSVLDQTYQDFEIVLIDDGSTDSATRHLFASYRRPRTRILRTENQGLARTRNLGIREAAGRYVSFLDADDLWYPQHLELQSGRMRAEGRAFSFSDFHRTSDPARPGEGMHAGYSHLAEGKVFTNLLRENFVPTSSAIVRKDLLAETGLFKPQLRGGQDFDLWLRIARRAEFTWLRPCLVFLRHHEGNISSSSNYPYMNVRLWEEILREHADCDPADRRYLRRRLGSEEYSTGRYAIREQKFSLARGYFRVDLAQVVHGGTDATSVTPISWAAH
jgi:glycosyltransferase involved in cell wall biosynthesis